MSAIITASTIHKENVMKRAIQNKRFSKERRALWRCGTMTRASDCMSREAGLERCADMWNLGKVRSSYVAVVHSVVRTSA